MSDDEFRRDFFGMPAAKSVIRDQFAMAALTGIMAATGAAVRSDASIWKPDNIARLAYQLAAAMLAERERAK